MLFIINRTVSQSTCMDTADSCPACCLRRDTHEDAIEGSGAKERKAGIRKKRAGEGMEKAEEARRGRGNGGGGNRHRNNLEIKHKTATKASSPADLCRDHLLPACDATTSHLGPRRGEQNCARHLLPIWDIGRFHDLPLSGCSILGRSVLTADGTSSSAAARSLSRQTNLRRT